MRMCRTLASRVYKNTGHIKQGACTVLVVNGIGLIEYYYSRARVTEREAKVERMLLTVVIRDNT